jgi:hypothetical protein
MKLDPKALDVATETLRPLFREPVSYLEQAARDCITAYITAASPAPADTRVDEIVTALYRRFKDWSKRGFGPDDVTWCEVRADVVALIAAPPAPVGEVGELVKRLRGLVASETQPGGEADECDDAMFSAADALESLSARLAECERERDEARNAGIAIGQSQGVKLHLELQDRVEALENEIDGIYIYSNDTLSGRSDGQPTDREWFRSCVIEMRNRARKFAKVESAVNARDTLNKGEG